MSCPPARTFLFHPVVDFVLFLLYSYVLQRHRSQRTQKIQSKTPVKLLKKKRKKRKKKRRKYKAILVESSGRPMGFIGRFDDAASPLRPPSLILLFLPPNHPFSRPPSCTYVSALYAICTCTFRVVFPFISFQKQVSHHHQQAPLAAAVLVLVPAAIHFYTLIGAVVVYCCYIRAASLPQIPPPLFVMCCARRSFLALACLVCAFLTRLSDEPFIYFFGLRHSPLSLSLPLSPLGPSSSLSSSSSKRRRVSSVATVSYPRLLLLSASYPCPTPILCRPLVVVLTVSHYSDSARGDS